MVRRMATVTLSWKQYVCSRTALKLVLCLLAVIMLLCLLRIPYTTARFSNILNGLGPGENPAGEPVYKMESPHSPSLTREGANEVGYSVLADGGSSHRCQMESCFDFSRCSLFSGFPVYFYPPHLTLGPLQSVFDSVTKSFSQVGHITQDGKNACVFVVLLAGRNPEDTVPASKLEAVLRSLPFWNSEGNNHVLINLDNESQDYFRGVNTGRALVVQPAFLASKLRHNFDVIIPSWDGNRLQGAFSSLPSQEPALREHFLSFWGEYVPASSKRRDLEAQGLSQRQKNVLSLMQNLQRETEKGADRISLTLSCDGSKDRHTQETEWALCGDATERAGVLSRSTFTLLVSPLDASLSSTWSFQRRLYEALKNGAIPLILGTMHERLPFSELLSWEKATLSLPTFQARDLLPYLRSFSQNDIAELRRTGRVFWENYFSSPDRIVTTALSAVRTRLRIPPSPARREPAVTLTYIRPPLMTFKNTSLGPTGPRFASDQFQRNFSLVLAKELFQRGGGPFSLFPHTPYEPVLPTAAQLWGPAYGLKAAGSLKTGANKQFVPELAGNRPHEQFTVMILTYRRLKSLLEALKRLNNLPYLNKIIIVWNDPVPPASDIQWPTLHVPVEVLKQRVNSLNNRFLPFDSIETECILSLDDDVVLSHDRILLGFKVWREERDRLVGFFARFHKWEDTKKRWLYTTGHFPNSLSIMITSATFFHAYYLYMYSYVMPQGVRDHVASRMNCEDIAMNFIVAHLSRRPPIKVKAPWKPYCPDCKSTLSSKGDHLKERHECMNVFAREFGYMPLLYTPHTVDSIPREDAIR